VLANWNSEAVLDRETGLVWERAPSVAGNQALVDWDVAVVECAGHRTGGRMGWRLPSAQELASLMDLSSTGSSGLPAGHPFIGIGSGDYWSVTTTHDNTRVAWRVNFRHDFFGLTGAVVRSDMSFPFNVWCVRSGQNMNPQ
jgi:hypothetical protein